jgi:putative heme-binding domain-containing protein
VLNNFHWGPDGWLYGALGQNNESRVGKPGTADEERVGMHRGMWRMHPLNHKFEVIARGMVNPWGADFNALGDLFTVNTVTAHLWYIVPGMECEDHSRKINKPYASIQAIGDHLHWGGGNWTDSRTTTESHSVAGGGHAHCGAMVYYGDNWPDKYRGTLFTNNLHGNRVNNDILRPRGSNYVGVHGEDFLLGNDPWFRGLSIKYGPDGGVYVSDWHDFGECHDTDGSHRTSGRIYKVVYGEAKPFQLDLQSMSSEMLAELHTHENEWLVRHARRILHERTVHGQNMDLAFVPLHWILRDSKDHVQRLRSLWTLMLMQRMEEVELARLLEDNDEDLRRWAVRLSVDQRQPSDSVIERLARLAHEDPSPAVRLQLAIALQRLPIERRWEIARGLASRGEDARDQFLPLMTWYGIEPLVMADVKTALQLATQSHIPVLREYIARKATESKSTGLDRMLTFAVELTSESDQLDVLRGVLAAIEGEKEMKTPAKWAASYEQFRKASNPELRSVAIRLATSFGDPTVISQLREVAMDAQSDDQNRIVAFQSLMPIANGLTVEHLHTLLDSPSAVRGLAIVGLMLKQNPQTAEVLLAKFAEFDAAEKQDAVGVLSTRLDFAFKLIDAIDSGKVAPESVSAYALQQLRSFSDEKLQAQINKHWPGVSDKVRKSEEIARYLNLMSEDFLAKGSAGMGRVVFDNTCAKCHALFGQGGAIGPDLTGSGRKKVDYVITNLVDPTATIDQAYRLTTAQTIDGRLYTGFMVQQDGSSVTLQMPEAKVKLDMKEVEELVTTNQSLMPEGMLSTFTDAQVRDLLLYLASDFQVAPAARAD